MDTITIPSPTAFLSDATAPQSTLLATSAVEPVKSNPKKPISPSTTARRKNSTANNGAASKQKQTKSRNGCITCKTKRLKCDETKPTCQQCHKRNVSCGGYKKEFKWKSFADTNGPEKVAPKAKKAPSQSQIEQPLRSRPSPQDQASTAPGNTSHPPGSATPPRREIHQRRDDSKDAMSLSTSPVQDHNTSAGGEGVFDCSLHADDLRQVPTGALRLSASPSDDAILEAIEASMAGEDSNPGISPRFLDLLLPDPDINQLPMDLPPPNSPQSFLDEGLPMDDDVEEIIRTTEPTGNTQFINDAADESAWLIRTPSPASSESSRFFGADTIMFNDDWLKVGTPEMLIYHFDQQTCGILSVKDGPTENPWRTHIFPLAQQSSALYHAINCMAAFHASREHQRLHTHGTSHMTKSINSLRRGMEKMSVDPHAAIATCLVLAFSDSWDRHTTSGIAHLRGAKALLRQLVLQPIAPEEVDRFRFLCNTWLYMDVLAKLTSLSPADEEDKDSNEFHAAILSFNGWPGHHEFDPLLGCAATLFPLIGRAGDLIRKVRSTERNSFTIISEATELKTLIEEWQPPALYLFNKPEDHTIKMTDLELTAKAYQYATLLYLHQAVPEIPSLPAHTLATETLKKLAVIPSTSRTLIVHIYPLLAASCEIPPQEDRQWIRTRWEQMKKRLQIGNVDKCVEVVEETWRRRDEYELAKHMRAAGRERSRPTAGGDMSSMLSRSGDPTQFQPLPAFRDRLGWTSSANSSGENMEPEYTVRGRLHWVHVMGERDWEVLLG